MADAFSEFYSGGMLAPNRVNGTLVPAQIYSGPTSVSEMYKGIYADAPPAISQLYDVGYDPRYPVSGGFLPNTWANPAPKSETATQAIEAAVPHANGSVDNNKMAYRAGEGGGSYLPAFGPYMTGHAVQQAPQAPRNIADLFGGLGVAGKALFGFGDPGQTDWSIANQGGDGINGDVRAPYKGSPNVYHPAAAPAPAPAPSIPSLFAPPSNQPGYNGNTSVYSGELAGANQGFGGVNALMPDSMNNSRWLTGY